jgi:hypothetical protein
VKQILFHKNLFFYTNVLKIFFVLRANIPSRHGKLFGWRGAAVIELPQFP